MKPAWLPAIALLIGAWPAAADVTARYVSPMTNAITMTIEVNDKGDSRASVGNQMAFLTVNGVAYILSSDLSGIYAVTQEDWIAVQTAQMRSALPANFGKGIPFPDYEMSEGGAETVGGRTGKLWRLKMKSEQPPPAGAGETGFDFVVCTDPDLAPVGRALADQMAASTAMMASITGAAHGFDAKANQIFAKGTVIRMSRVMSFDGVDTSPIPASEFALPATILTREQFAARSGARPS